MIRSTRLYRNEVKVEVSTNTHAANRLFYIRDALLLFKLSTSQARRQAKFPQIKRNRRLAHRNSMAVLAKVDQGIYRITISLLSARLLSSRLAADSLCFSGKPVSRDRRRCRVLETSSSSRSAGYLTYRERWHYFGLPMYRRHSAALAIVSFGTSYRNLNDDLMSRR